MPARAHWSALVLSHAARELGLVDRPQLAQVVPIGARQDLTVWRPHANLDHQAIEANHFWLLDKIHDQSRPARNLCSASSP